MRVVQVEKHHVEYYTVLIPDDEPSTYADTVIKIMAREPDSVRKWTEFHDVKKEKTNAV